MPLRKPLVIISGQVQQLQAGDTLDASIVGQETLQLTNSESGSIVIGTPVYLFGADSVKKARANASGTARVIGLVADASIAASASGSILTDGVLTATTTQWDAVAGTTGGLAAGTVYYLSPTTAGQITATAPTTVGQLVTEIGTAISTTELRVSAQPPILL